jgi:hypothetical protein
MEFLSNDVYCNGPSPCQQTNGLVLNTQWKKELTQDMRAIQPSLRDFVKSGL